MMVFVVDDYEGLAEQIADRMATKFHYEIMHENRAEMALLKIYSTEPDLVITDVRMPGLNGLDLSKKVKAKFPKMPVILLTAFNVSPTEFIYSGASTCIDKAVDPEFLDSVIKKLLP